MKLLIFSLLLALSQGAIVTWTGDTLGSIESAFSLASTPGYSASGFTDPFGQMTTVELVATGPSPCTGTCARIEHWASIGQSSLLSISFPTGTPSYTLRLQGRTPANTATMYSIFLKFHSGVATANGGCSGGQTQANQEFANNNADTVFDFDFTVSSAATTCVLVEGTATDLAPMNDVSYWFFDNIVLSPPTPVPTPAPIPGGGDPHFKPLNGDNVWFTPVGPKTPAVYNLITHQNLQVNSMWKRSANYEQLISEVAVLSFSPETAKETRTLISVVGQGRNSTLLVKVDGALVAAGVSTDSLKWKGKNKVEVTTDLAVLTYFIAYSKPASYLDFFVSKMDKPALRGAHGILGQTARDNVPYRQPNAVELSAMKRDPLLGCTKCYVEGQVGQYIVTDGIYGKEFQYNLYRK